jgi:Rrf2 family protein
MSANSRMAVAVHVLTLLAQHVGSELITSEYIAGSVNTNPVVVRRLLASLRAAKLVTSQGGPGGGWVLARDPRAITLRDVFIAMAEGSLFPLHTNEPNPKCPVGRSIQKAVVPHFQSAQAALEDDLARTTIADVLKTTAG